MSENVYSLMTFVVYDTLCDINEHLTLFNAIMQVSTHLVDDGNCVTFFPNLLQFITVQFYSRVDNSL